MFRDPYNTNYSSFQQDLSKNSNNKGKYKNK